MASSRNPVPDLVPAALGFARDHLGTVPYLGPMLLGAVMFWLMSTTAGETVPLVRLVFGAAGMVFGAFVGFVLELRDQRVAVRVEVRPEPEPRKAT